MPDTGFIIEGVSVEGPNKPNAVLSFSAGLNVVAGASNTGKTYVFKVIDFMLGGGESPKPIPQSNGYAEAYIQLRSKTGAISTLRRSLQGGDFLLYNVPISEVASNESIRTLASKHEKGNLDTASGHLLELSGLFGRELRTNAQGVKRSLSFRDIAGLSLIDEERIIAERSPALSEQVIHDTVAKNLLGLFLTGVDDTSVVTHEKPKERKARVGAEIALLAQLIANRQERLESLKIDESTLADQKSKVRESIDAASNLISAAQDELNEVAGRRDEAWSLIQDMNSRRRFLAVQLKRMSLLREHYNSDSARLESSLEAGWAFERIPTGECPICGSKPVEGETNETASRLTEFQDACNAELAKIRVLLRDLTASEDELRSEDKKLGADVTVRESQLRSDNAAIADLLMRKQQMADQDLSSLLELNSRLGEAALIAAEIQDLQGRHETAEKALKEKTPKLELAEKVETSTASKFCAILEGTLRAWKFPFDGHVSFDPKRFDVVIGDQNRGSFGKGYRAVTHAAFVVSLMRYCRSEGLPHPGVVVLDTPLNPFKGADKDSAERVNMEVQNAFYADLETDRSGDQFIVFENTEPPASFKSTEMYMHFSGNASTGRAGFFPEEASAAG
jgi:hypothetical protein